jgi:hypothetical protein
MFQPDPFIGSRMQSPTAPPTLAEYWWKSCGPSACGRALGLAATAAALESAHPGHVATRVIDIKNPAATG